MINDVIDTCETCFKHNKPKPRPIVGFPLAKHFSETRSA